MGRVPRAYVPELAPSPGRRVELTGAEAHHVLRVLRLARGEPLALFDGRGVEWRGTIVETAREQLVVRLDEPELRAVEARTELTLFQGTARDERLEWLVQKATEIGVARVAIVRGSARRRGGPAPRQMERLARVAIEACKQCGRRVVPRIDEVDGLPKAQDLSLLLDPRALETFGAACPVQPLARAAVAIGPEGGFGAEQVAAALAQGWRAVSLGPRTLRAETAGLVAAALVLHRMDDLGSTTEPD
jgi:16S rRNA (uracil1498-N3)-methyltransferase